MRANSGQLTRENGDPIQMSLFEAVVEEDLNLSEQEIAVHLDKQEQFILWWDRNFSRLGYYVQGWEKERIYPDFLVSKRDTKNTMIMARYLYSKQRVAISTIKTQAIRKMFFNFVTI